MVIFPLSWPARIVLMLIAVVLGLIWSMMVWPSWWRKLLGRKNDKPENKSDNKTVEKTEKKTEQK